MAQGRVLARQRGIEGETDAAFHIDSLMRDGRNTVVLHDLRLVVDGDVAQIDHLVFNRMLEFILVETKCYGGHVQINDAAEFTVQYDSGKRFGVPSPIAQSERHARVLAKLLDRLEIAGRLGTQPKFHHVVMLHPKAIIERPDAKRFNTSNVIKADQFAQWRERWIDKGSALDALAGLFNVRGKDTLQDWAERLAHQHQPIDLLALPTSYARVIRCHIEPNDNPTKPSSSNACRGRGEGRLICARCNS